ncbi:MAG: protease modulator HflC [Methylococcaceae bacterium]|nr:protease modulator HflC [Methylococcaceae bacterium]
MTQINRVLVLLVAAVLLGSMSVFTVGQTQKAIKFQMGEIVETSYSPGLYFKIPFINNVKKFDARILTLESKPERFLTSEKKNVIVDSFAKWRIKDVAKYYKTVAGDITAANVRLDQIVKDAMRGEFSKRTIRELVSSERGQIRDILIHAANPVADEMGIDIVDIRVMRVDLPGEVSSSVYRRMEAERARVAREFRSRGAEMAERIRADADRQRDVIVGEAYRDAELKRGEGDAEAADVSAQAYGKNRDFYAFYRSLSAYKQAFKRDGNSIVLDSESEFFQYFKKSK